MTTENNDKLEELRDKKYELQQGILNVKISSIRAELNSIADILHEEMKKVEDTSKIHFSYITKALKSIEETGNKTYEQSKETNGRVNKLEINMEDVQNKVETNEKHILKKIDALNRETRFVRFMHKYPVPSFVIVIFMYIFTIKEIRDLIVEHIGNLISLVVKLI